jgi:hypothetical protein
MAALQGVVGEQSNSDSTALVTARFGKGGELMVSELLPAYAELALRGRVFTSYVSAVATSLAATATIGNMIWNPPGSGVKLVLLDWTSQIVATSATCTGIAIAGGYQTTTPTTTTAANVAGSMLVADTTLKAGKSKAFSIATVLTAPVVMKVLHHNTAAINTVGMEMMSGDFKGMIVVEEGGFVTLCALGAAAAASGHTSSLTYAEIAK